MNITTKKYARTMREAFGVDAREAYAIERYKLPLWEKWADIATAVVLGLLLAVGGYYWMAS